MYAGSARMNVKNMRINTMHVKHAWKVALLVIKNVKKSPLKFLSQHHFKKGPQGPFFMGFG